MIGLRTVRKFRCPIAVCVILSIASVFGCDFLCDLGVVSFQLPQPSIISEASGHSHQHEGDHHSSGPRHNQQSQESVNHHHESTNEESCCDDLTQRFYSSLVDAAGAHVIIIHAAVYKLINTFTYVDLNEINTDGKLTFNSKFEHPPNGPPGTSGQAIRVFINSFLI